MRGFLKRVLGFVALQAVVFAAVYGLYRDTQRSSSHYLLAWQVKDERLRGPGSGRLLIAGGSNVALGINSRMFEGALGRPVLNLGLHAGLGRELVLRQIEENVRPGDVVVLSLEYQLLRSEVRDVTLPKLLLTEPRAARYLDWQLMTTLLDYGLIALGDLPKVAIYRLRYGLPHYRETAYSLSAFNEYGDAVWHRDRTPPFAIVDIPSVIQVIGDPSDATVERLALLRKRCRGRGALVFLAFPPAPDEVLQARAPALLRMQGILERSGIPILESAWSSFYPREWFYDGSYHLNAQGTRARSRHIIAALQAQLGVPAPTATRVADHPRPGVAQ